MQQENTNKVNKVTQANINMEHGTMEIQIKAKKKQHKPKCKHKYTQPDVNMTLNIAKFHAIFLLH